jgi:hypothetical protein
MSIMSKWELNLRYPKVCSAYNAYLANLERIEAMYAFMLFGTELIQSLDDVTRDIVSSLDIRLSDNFSDGVTTIHSGRSMLSAVESCEIQNDFALACLLAICSSVEDFVGDLFSLCDRPEVPKDVTLRNGIHLTSPTVLKIIAIDRQWTIHSNIIDTVEISFLQSLIHVRNAVAHNVGRANEKMAKGCVGRWKQQIAGTKIIVEKNDIDEAFHFVLLPMISLVQGIDAMLSD